MPRYWVMAPFEANPAEQFEKVWQFDLANNVISLGFSRLGDTSALSREQLAAVVAKTYPDKPASTRSLIANMFWSFYHEMLPGDIVVARRGRKGLAGIGRVVGPPAYSPGRASTDKHGNVLPVEWQASPRDKRFSEFVFPMHTLSPLTEEAYRNVVGDPTTSAEPLDQIDDPASFVLEKYLEDFIVTNFSSIFKGEFKIYVDDEGNEGQQYSTDIGPIDILAQTSAGDSFVVIELKRGRPSDQVVGQVLRYMGWVKKNLCGSGQGVRGLVICHEADPKLAYALAMTDLVDVRYYSVSFKLRESP